MQEEDPDAVSWSNKIAKKIMLSGTPVFEALKKGLKSNVSEVTRNSLITVAWLGYELSAVQRNHLRPIARDIILPEIVTFMQPGIELEERVLASLSIYNYTAGSGTSDDQCQNVLQNELWEYCDYLEMLSTKLNIHRNVFLK